MTDEQSNYVKQAGAFQLRLQRVLYALREMDGAQRHIKNLQWSCPAEVNVKAGLELTREGLLDQAIRDVDDAIALTDLAVSGESEPAIEPEPEPEVLVPGKAEAGVDCRYDYDWPEETTRLTVEGFNSVVDRHIAHAIEKHSLFAHELCEQTDHYAKSATMLQTQVEEQLKAGCVYADTLLWEEVYEFLAEVEKGDITRAKAEAGDVAAVLYRMIKLMEERQ